MVTPAGSECRYYYEDFHRGRNRQECRLIGSAEWHPKDCQRCPVPAILRANADPNLRLEGTIKRGFLGIGRQVVVTAWCARHDTPIDDPFVGCRACAEERPGMSLFFSEE